MKKYFMALLLFMFFTVSNAEMVWVGFNPTPKTTDVSGSSIAPNLHLEQDLMYGQTISTVVKDSAADSTYGIWYSYPINTHDVVSATGIVELMIVVDTSADDTLNPFGVYGDSVTVGYALYTGYIPYDISTDYSLIATATMTAVSGTAVQKTITLSGQFDEVPDTLFKPWSWFEITIRDTTGWISGYSQKIHIAGTGDSGFTVAGTYSGVGFDPYKLWIFDPGNDDDSIIWGHYDYVADTLGPLDSSAITASAQNLDSGITVNFDDADANTANDTFMIWAGDSLYYNKQTDFRIRMGLNLHRRK
jgi:hypothetical protein